MKVWLLKKKSQKYSLAVGLETWMQSQKWQNDLGLLSRQTIHHHNNTSLCPKHWCRRSWSWPVLWRSAIPSRTNNNKKIFSLHHKGLEYKCRKSRDTKNNRNILQRSTKWSRAKLTKFCHENTLVIANTYSKIWELTLHLDITICQHQNQTDNDLCSQDGESLYSQ